MIFNKRKKKTLGDNAIVDQSSSPKIKPRRFQYSLRTLLLFVLVCALACSWLGVKLKRARDQRDAVGAILNWRGEVYYDYETDASGNQISGKSPPEQTWFNKFLGTDFRCVTGVTVENDKQMAYLEALPDIRSLTIVGDVTDDGLAHASGLSQLRRLRIYSYKITDGGLVHLANMPYLQSLQIDRGKVTPAGLVHLQNSTQLEELGLSIPYRQDNAAVDSGLKYISKFTKLRHIPFVMQTDAQLEQIAAMTQLKYLWLRGKGITDAGLAHIAKFNQLVQLNIEETEVTDAGLEYLKELAKLKLLDLSKNNITAAGLKCHEGLNQLISLDLSGNNITDPGLEHLKALAKLSHLRLNNTAITDAGLKNLKNLSGLKYLDLRDTRVSDVGLEQIKDLKELRELNLSNTRVSDAGLQHLKRLIFLARLRCDGTKITNEGLLDLKRTSPNLELPQDKQETPFNPWKPLP
jgi:internalin A